MVVGLYSLVSEDLLKDVLETLHAFAGLYIRLLDSDGNTLASFGRPCGYCRVLNEKVFKGGECFHQHTQSAHVAQALGESYIFSCRANLNHISFPLVSSGELMGSVLAGPFLLEEPDSTLVSGLASEEELSSSLSLELYDELRLVPVYTPKKANQLKKLMDYLLSPLIPEEQIPLLQARKRMYQQSRINESIQELKVSGEGQSLAKLYSKEQELLSKVRSGTVNEVKALLNELIGYVLFSEGGQLESVRIRAIELTTLLSRVAIDGGANADSIYHLNGGFISRLYYERSTESLCMLMQEVLESFMRTMFNEQDKGNHYIRKALRYMNDNYSEKLELGKVASYVGLSPSYFSTLFRKTVGVSFSEELCRIRVEASKQLLETKKYDLADIAAAMGFPDQSYYCKVFKRIVGVTPSKYRT